jgi:Mrp family chromosome partitioning ATPase
VAARRNLRTLLVVGADASVSSGRIVAELGVALAESGRRVLLVAADLRGSPLPQIFGMPDTTGLSNLLVGACDPEALCRQPKQAAGAPLPPAIVKRLAVLPSGSQTALAHSLLDSGAMIDLLERRRDAYEFVVLDAPPATVAADVFALAAHADGVIVIAREARTRDRTLEDLCRRLDQVGALVIGGVFIGKGRPGRHGHRPAGAQPAASLAIASADGRAAEQAGNPPRSASRSLPAIRDEAGPRTSGGLAKRPS